MATTIVSSTDSAGISLSSAGSVTVTSAGTLTGAIHDTTESPNFFYSAIFASNAAPLYVSNSGTIMGPSGHSGQFANGIDMRDGGTIVNQKTGLIEGLAYGYGIFANSSPTLAIVIENAGTVESSNHAIAIEDSGTVSITNSSTGIILGSNDPLFLQLNRSETVVNAGHISATSQAGYLTAQYNLYMTNASTGTVSGSTGGLVLDGRSTLATTTLLNAGLINGGSGYGVGLGDGANALLVNKAGATISGGSEAIYVFANYAGVTATVSNAGLITGTVGLDFQTYGSAMTEVVTNTGTITGTGGEAIFGGNAGLHLNIGVGAVFNGSVVAGATLATFNPATNSYSYTANTLNVLELESGSGAGTLSGVGTAFENFDSIVIDTGGHWLVAGDAAGLADGQTIYGFSSADTLELTGFAATSSHFAAGALTLSNGSSTEILRISETAGSSADFTIATVGTNTYITTDLACFYPGTGIATPDGVCAVEALREGDWVLTTQGPSQVRWVGESPVSTRFADPLRVLPIRIEAGALGAGLPRRDLLLSPDHALFLDGMLVQAGALAGLTGISRHADVPACFTYYHVELAGHQLLLAEGVAAESFVDNAGWGGFANLACRQAPEAPVAEMPYPRVKSARQLSGRLRAMLHCRAAA